MIIDKINKTLEETNNKLALAVLGFFKGLFYTLYGLFLVLVFILKKVFNTGEKIVVNILSGVILLLLILFFMDDIINLIIK